MEDRQVHRHKVDLDQQDQQDQQGMVVTKDLRHLQVPRETKDL
jgi:hypothetical protein